MNYTVCRPIQETCYKTCAYTVCRPVQIGQVSLRALHRAGARAAHGHAVPAGHRNGAGAAVRVQAGALHRLAARSARRTCRNAATRFRFRSSGPRCGRPRTRSASPVRETSPSGVPLHRLQARPDDHVQDGLEDVLSDSERDGIPRNLREGVRTQDGDEAGLPHHQRDRGSALLCPRQDGLHQRLPGAVPRNLVRKDGLLPAHRDRERLLHGVRVAARQEAGARHRVQEGAVHGLRAGPRHHLPVGRPGMRQAGPGHDLPAGERDSASSKSPSRSANT